MYPGKRFPASLPANLPAEHTVKLQVGMLLGVEQGSKVKIAVYLSEATEVYHSLIGLLQHSKVIRYDRPAITINILGRAQPVWIIRYHS